MISKRQALKYCCEDVSLIENYDKAVQDTSLKWHCHHKLEMFKTKKELIAMGRYYNVPARELVFVTPKEHMQQPHKGIDDRKKRLKGMFIGENNPFYGKHHSEETLRKLRGPKTEEHKRKLSKALKGHVPWIKGKHLNKETIKKMQDNPIRNKGVRMIKADGSLVMDFISQSAAARWLRENGYPHAAQGGIANVLRGKQKVVYGATWENI